MSAIAAIPYVVGQWVRGERFYGRSAQIAEVLGGKRENLWLLGTRRIGKTSLLRQLELLAEAEDSDYLPLFWDLQGADEPGELHLSFHDALLDAEERLQRLDVDPSAMDPADLFGSLNRVRRRIASSGRKILLLCDEVEELIKLHRQDPSLLRKLLRAMQSGGQVRTVLASTIRLWTLAEQRENTSPFLHGFTPPVYLATLTDEEARQLLLQRQLSTGEKPQLSESAVEAIRQACDSHPYLLQLVGKRYLEVGDVSEALEQVATDEMVSYFFAVDFEMLSKIDQEVLRTVGQLADASSGSLEGHLNVDPTQVTGSLMRLEGLGFLRRDNNQRLILANHFFKRWLEHAEQPISDSEIDDRPEALPLSERVTEIMSDLESRPEGLKASPPELLEMVYGELRQLARSYMSRERPDHTLQPTALVHEAYLRLADQSRVDWQGRTHFFAMGAKMMRRILIDHARRRHRAKRGGDWLEISWADEILPLKKGEMSSEELLDLDRAIEELSQVSQRQARIVELRYFAGLTVREVADFLGVSKRTAEADWTQARKWLKGRLSKGASL